MLHYTLDQSLNSRPKYTTFSLALAGLMDNKAHRTDMIHIKSSSYNSRGHWTNNGQAIEPPKNCSYSTIGCLDIISKSFFSYKIWVDSKVLLDK